MATMEELLGGHRFFAGLGSSAVQLIAGCASNVHFAAGDYIFGEGEAAGRFYVIRHGRVALEIHSPTRGLSSSTPWTRERCSGGRGSSRLTAISGTPGR